MDEEIDLPFLAFNANDTKFLRKAFTTLSKTTQTKIFFEMIIITYRRYNTTMYLPSNSWWCVFLHQQFTVDGPHVKMSTCTSYDISLCVSVSKKKTISEKHYTTLFHFLHSFMVCMCCIKKTVRRDHKRGKEVLVHLLWMNFHQCYYCERKSRLFLMHFNQVYQTELLSLQIKDQNL